MTMGVRSRAGRSAAACLAALLAAAFLAIIGSPGVSAEETGEVSAQGTLGNGYALVATDGGIFNYGDSDFFGSTGSLPLNQPIVGMAYTPTGEGYWLVAADGGIFAFGDAPFLGSTGNLKLNQPIVGMAATPSGQGYWLVASDGGIFAFGDAQFYGSTGNLKLVRPIVGMAPHPSGLGYWLVAADGGIFTFGDPAVVRFWGSQGGKPLNKPVVGMAATRTGNGYFMVATDGGLFTFGDATFRGSQGGKPLNKPINGMTLTPTGQGYWMVASDGGIFTFGDAPFLGSRGGAPLNKPVVGMSATPFSPVTAPDFVVALEGGQEVPGPGDADGSGIALLDFTDDEVCWYVQANSIGTPTMAHIHEAPAGVAGPIVFAFDPAPSASGVTTGCKAIDPALSASIMADPERYYVNVHSEAMPNGAVRGQLADELVVAATATNQLLAFFSSAPEEIVLGPSPITGLGAGEVVAGIDVRPKTGDFYVLTQEANVGRLYVLDDNDAATRVGNADLDLGAAVGVGFDFNPVTDRIRVTTGVSDNSIVVNPDTGVEQSRTSLTPNTVEVAGVAYTNNVPGTLAPSTTLYGIDSAGDQLVTIDPATGAVTNVGALGFGDLPFSGFDVAPAPAGKAGTALLVVADGTDTPALRALNLATGTSLSLGEVGDGTLSVVAATIV